MVNHIKIDKCEDNFWDSKGEFGLLKNEVNALNGCILKPEGLF